VPNGCYEHLNTQYKVLEISGLISILDKSRFCSKENKDTLKGKASNYSMDNTSNHFILMKQEGYAPTGYILYKRIRSLYIKIS